MTDQSLMPFGKYKGTAIGLVPGKYLLELNKTLKDGPVKEYIKNNSSQLGSKKRY